MWQQISTVKATKYILGGTYLTECHPCVRDAACDELPHCSRVRVRVSGVSIVVKSSTSGVGGVMWSDKSGWVGGWEGESEKVHTR